MAVVARMSLLQFFTRVELAILDRTAVSGLARIQKMMALSLMPSLTEYSTHLLFSPST